MAAVTGFVLGIDAGQTATKAMLASLAGPQAWQVRGGPVDHFKQSGAQERNAEVIAETVATLCMAAGVGVEEIVASAAGWTAARPGMPEIDLVGGILASVLPRTVITVVPDYVIGLAGASGGAPGIVVVAGGGSIAYGVTATGREAVVGGLGYLLGDEGSAFDIGRRAVAAAARSSDGRGRYTVLEERIRAEFALHEVREITRLVYARDFSRDRLARLAPLVARTAMEGDRVAQEIMTYAGEELAQSVLAVARRLDVCSPDIYPVGGVFRAGEIVLMPFRRTVGAGLPQARIRAPAWAPLVGAVLLAHRAAGLPDDPIWVAAVAGTLDDASE